MNVEEKLSAIELVIKDHTKEIHFLKEDRAETKLYIKQILGYIADIRSDISELKNKKTEDKKFDWDKAMYELAITLAKGLILVSTGLLGLKATGII